MSGLLARPSYVVSALPAAAATIAIVATGAVLARFGFVHFEVTAHELGPIKGRDRLRGLLVIIHFDKAEALGLAGKFVTDYGGARHSTDSGKELVQMLVGHGVSQIADV